MSNAKYVRIMIGTDAYNQRWTAPKFKFVQRVMEINSSNKSLVERLCKFKIYAISVPYAHPTFRRSRVKTMPL